MGEALRKMKNPLGGFSFSSFAHCGSGPRIGRSPAVVCPNYGWAGRKPRVSETGGRGPL